MKLKEFGESSQIIGRKQFPHGRTTTIVSFWWNARKNFGPFTAGFIKIPYDDTDALEPLINHEYCWILSWTYSGEAEFMFQVKVIWPKPKHFASSTMFIYSRWSTNRIARTGDVLLSVINCKRDAKYTRSETRYYHSRKAISGEFILFQQF
jgi:ornithine--oxo-acid transaminase